MQIEEQFENIVNKFINNTSYLTNGAGQLSNKWGITKDLVKAAKASAKDILKNKEQFGTEYNPKDVAFNGFTDISLNNIKDGDFLVSTGSHNKMGNGKLKSKWGSEGNWKYSYDYSQDSASQINFEEILNKVFNSNEKVPQIVYKEEKSSEYSLNIYLTDQHIGAMVEHSLYPNYFDKHVYKDRMNKVGLEIIKLSSLYHFKQINVFFLGDTFDGQDAFTVKRTHNLPQNMSNEECFETGLYTNKIFLERLFASRLANKYTVQFVRESNHGGDMDLYLFKALKMWMDGSYNKDFVEARIAHSFIDNIVFGNHTFIYTHGKDNRDMKNGLPLNLDPKTEIFINQYIYEKNLRGNIHCVKGDLHQDAFNASKLFSYRNVPSLFGSSKWIMSNYGLTEPGVGYDIFNDNIKRPISGIIEF